MSTTDPDARSASIGARLQPFALPALVVGILVGPVLATVNWSLGSPTDLIAPTLLGYVVISVLAGLFLYYLPHRPGPLAIAAYVLAYMGGLFLVMGSNAPLDQLREVAPGFVITGIFYLLAIVFAVLQYLRTTAVKQTMAHGIDTTGTVQSAGVDGMINYVQHQRLTVAFTDNQGVKRWVRVGKTGGGYAAGDKVSVRYDPQRPSSRFSIIVGN